jgi:excisionase family DNA binding protein
MKKSELKELYTMIFPNYPDIVNVAQLQQMLGIGRHHAYSLIRDGYIPGILIGNAYRVPKANVIDYVYNAMSDSRPKEASV